MVQLFKALWYISWDKVSKQSSETI